jgi:hypothetical protein
MVSGLVSILKNAVGGVRGVQIFYLAVAFSACGGHERTANKLGMQTIADPDAHLQPYHSYQIER